MTRWFVFVDTPYYPYVGDQVEADTADEALEKATANEGPGGAFGLRIYVAPLESVYARGPDVPEHVSSESLAEIQAALNRARAQRRDELSP